MSQTLTALRKKYPATEPSGATPLTALQKKYPIRQPWELQGAGMRAMPEGAAIGTSTISIPLEKQYRQADVQSGMAALKERMVVGERRKTPISALTDGLQVASMNMASEFGGWVRIIGEMTPYKDAPSPALKNLIAYAQVEGGQAPTTIRKGKMRPAAKKLARWGRFTSLGAEEYLQAHPELQQTIEPGRGFLGTLAEYATKPENIIQGIAETSPLLMQAWLGHLTGTGVASLLGKGKKYLPWLGRVQGIALPIMGQRYHEGREQGMSPEMALGYSFLSAEGEGLVEEFSLGRKVKIFKGFAANVGKASGAWGLLKRMAVGGAKVFARGTAEEMTQEIQDKFWQNVFGNTDPNILKNVLEVGATGGVLELAMAGGFAGGGKVMSKLSPQEKVKRVNAVKERMTSPEAGLSEQEKVEVTKVTDTEVEKLTVGVEDIEVGKKPTPTARAVEEIVGKKPAPEVTDAAKVQTLRNSIAEGELILRTGKFNDKVRSTEYLQKVHAQVIKDKRRIGDTSPTPDVKPTKAKPAPEAKGKEPWEMTKAEATQLAKEWSIRLAEEKNETARQQGFDILRDAERHRLLVLRAAKAGKPVPSAVLADYPDLAEKYGKKAKPLEEATVDRLAAKVGELGKKITEEGKKRQVAKELYTIKEKLRAEARALREGKKIGRAEARKNIYRQLKSRKIGVEGIRRAIVDYAQENLTSLDRNQIKVIASRARTAKGLERALNQIDRMEEKYQRHVAVDELKEAVKRIDFKTLRPEYRKGVAQQIVELANSIDLINRQSKTIAHLAKLAGYIRENPDHTIPKHHLSRLGILDKTPIRDVTTEDLRLITNSVKHLVRLNELKNKILFGRRLRDFAEVRDHAVENVEKKPEPDDIDPRVGIKSSRLKRVFTSDSVNIEFICRMLDGGDTGAIKSIVYDGIDQGVTKLLRIRQEARDFFARALDKIKLSRWSESFHAGRWRRRRNVDYHEYKLDSGQTLRLTKAERIALELHTRSQANLRHILEGGIRLSGNPVTLYKISPEDLDRVTESLTKDESKVADTVHRYLNTTQPEQLNELSVRLNGWEIATEPDYFPIKVHWLDVPRNYLQKPELLPTDMRQYVQTTLEGMGILKERVRGKTPLVLEDAFVTLYTSIKQASTYCGLAEPMRATKALVFDKKFQAVILKRYDPGFLNAFKNYINDIEGEYQRIDNIDKILLGTINRLDVAILGLNPWVALKQTISYMNALTEVPFKYWRKAFVHRAAQSEVMAEWSPQLRDRYEGNVTRELGEIAGYGRVRQFWTGKHSIGQRLMSWIRSMDRWAIGRIWNAVTYEIEETQPDLKAKYKWQEVAKRTEEVVRLTQPTFHSKDRSGIGRSRNLFVRLATKYTSQRNKNYMMIGRFILRYNRSNKGPAAKARLMRDIGIVTLGAALMIWAINELRRIVYKRKRPERRLRDTLLGMLETVMGNVYFVGPLFYSLASKIRKGTFGGYDINNVLISTIDTGVDAIAESAKATEQAITKEEYKAGKKKGEPKWETSALRAIDKAISVTSRLRGLPYDTTKKLLMGGVKWATGEKEEVKPPKTYKQTIRARKRGLRKSLKKKW